MAVLWIGRDDLPVRATQFAWFPGYVPDRPPVLTLTQLVPGVEHGPEPRCGEALRPDAGTSGAGAS